MVRHTSWGNGVPVVLVRVWQCALFLVTVGHWVRYTATVGHWVPLHRYSGYSGGYSGRYSGDGGFPNPDTETVVSLPQQGLVFGVSHGQWIRCHCGPSFGHRNKRHIIRHRPSGPKQKCSELRISISLSTYDEKWCHFGFSQDCCVFQK